MLRAFITLIDRISKFCGFIGGIIICLLAVLLMWDVFMRFVVNRPVYWVLDITQLLQSAMALIVAGYVLKLGGHVNMSAIIAIVNNSWKKVLRITHMTITAICCAWMAYLGWPLYSKSAAVKECTFGVAIPLAPWKLLVMVGFALLCLQAFGTLVKYVITAPEDFAEPKEE